MRIFSPFKSFFSSVYNFIIRRKIISLFFTLVLILAGILLNLYLSLPDVRGFIKGIPGTTSMIDQRINESSRQNKKFIIRKKWASVGQIPPFLKRIVIVSEDIDFYNHKGIDFFELKESIKKNFQTGKKARGGSTITQQLAKNLYLSTEKSYYRKIKEFFIAKRLEKHLTKNRILEIYLNVIEFGRGIFGVGAASEFFFNKRVDQLSRVEMIRLISIIPKPLRVSPLSDSGYLMWRANLLINRLYKSRSIKEEEFIRLKDHFPE